MSWDEILQPADRMYPDAPNEMLQTILREGPLSRRIQRVLHGDATRLETVYRELCDCLAQGRMFL